MCTDAHITACNTTYNFTPTQKLYLGDQEDIDDDALRVVLLFPVEIPAFFYHPVPTFDDTESSNCEEPLLPSSAGMPVLVCLVKEHIHISCFSGYNHGVDLLVCGCMPSSAFGCSITLVSDLRNICIW